MAKEFEVKTRITAEDAATPAAARAEGAFKKFANYLSGAFVITLNDVARIAQAAFGRIFDVAKLEGQTQALRIELAKQGQVFDQFIAKLDEVARGTVSTADLIKSSSQALLLGIPAEQIASLLEIARASAIATGKDVAEAFNDIATGIGRASPQILDNLGIVVQLGPAYDAMAGQVGKSVEQLTAAEQKQAVLNAVLEVGKSRVEAYGEAQSGLAESIARATVAQDNFVAGSSKVVAALATSASIIVNLSVHGWVAFAEAVARARIQWNLWTNDLGEAAEAAFQARELEKLRDRMLELGESLGKLRDQQWETIMGRGGEAAQAAAEKTARLALAAEDTRARMGDLATATQATTLALDGTATSADDLATSLSSGVDAALREIEVQRQLQTALAETSRAIIFNAQQWEYLARTRGRAAATEAAVAAGGRTILGGTRVLLPGGGSRLTSEPGFGRFGG